ncbi:hypothetical protein GME_16152 [Halomonas sp. TD01]|nr:hypothetical protein GME_16152 [Halomonas sp. TD01]
MKWAVKARNVSSPALNALVRYDCRKYLALVLDRETFLLRE